MPTTLMLKIAGYVFVGILTLGIGYKAYNMVSAHFQNVKDTQTMLSNERIKRERSDVALALLRNTIDLEDEHDKAVGVIREKHKAEMIEVRKESEEQKAVLEDRERLRRLTLAKPGLLEKLANNATKDRFDELQTIFNN